jgi:endonuclease/exonuclease/phosphatase family metal-dependent hydrolase
MNCLPPGDEAVRLPPKDRSEYPEAVTPLQPLFDRYASPVPEESWNTEPERWRTYLPFGAIEPDRTLDYVFHGSRVRTSDISVLRDHPLLSDHLPLLFRFRIAS